MGDDKWTRRERGSISGSLVPPPAVREESARTSRPPLPRRWSKADRRSAQASGVGGEQSPSQPGLGPQESGQKESGQHGSGSHGSGVVSAAVPGPPPAASLPPAVSPSAALPAASLPAASLPPAGSPSASLPAASQTTSSQTAVSPTAAPLPAASPTAAPLPAASPSAAASARTGLPGDASSDPGPGPGSGRTGGLGQRRLHVAEPQAPAAAPQLPDNVRYLFRPVLNQPVDGSESAETATRATEARATGARASGTKAETQKTSTERKPPASHRSPGRDRVAAAAFQQTATAPIADRLDEPDQTPEPELSRSPQPQPHTQPQPQLRTQPAVETAEPAASVQPRWLAWLHSDARPGQHAATDRSQLRRHLGWAAAVFLVVVTAVGTAFALFGTGPSANRARPASAGSSPGQTGGRTAATGAKALAGLSGAGITRARAAQWIVREISRSAIIACDDVMCNQLINEGLPASNVLVLGPSAADPLGADIVVGTPALRSQFGSRLALVYAPSVLASFGRGLGRIDIRVVAPDGAAAYEEAFTKDLENRQHYGDILLSNSQITVSPEAKPDVVSGLVDPRLLSMLPVLAEQHPIQILGFFDRAPGAGEGIPLSGVELAGSDSSSGMDAASYQRWLLGFLHSQRAPYLAASITKSIVHGRDVIFVRFTRPSPIGLLSGQ
jgi:hypothetical protein